MLENHISLTSRSSDLMRCEGIFVVNTFYSTFYINLLYNIETFIFTEKKRFSNMQYSRYWKRSTTRTEVLSAVLCQFEYLTFKSRESLKRGCC